MPILSINSVEMPLPDADGIAVKQQAAGAQDRMLSGKLRADERAVKTHISLRWSLLSKGQRDALYAAWLDALTTTRTLILPDAQTFTVKSLLTEFPETQFYDVEDTDWYGVTLEFMET